MTEQPNGNKFLFTEKPTLTKVTVIGKGHKEAFYVAYGAEDTATKIKEAFGWNGGELPSLPAATGQRRRGRPRRVAATETAGIGVQG